MGRAANEEPGHKPWPNRDLGRVEVERVDGGDKWRTGIGRCRGCCIIWHAAIDNQVADCLCAKMRRHVVEVCAGAVSRK
ncbi:hypothetical protein D5I55_16530 [Chakrabartia godavariana]|nr:hypothetical protein D5I55_16530 [Chakrabartia godavariana]